MSERETEGMTPEEADAWAEAQAAAEAEEEANAPALELLQREIKALKRKLQHGEGVESLVQRCVAEHYRRPAELLMPPKPTLQGKGTEQVAIAHLSDTQMGKRTASYDSVVGAKRCHLFAKRVVEITEIKRAGSTIKELRLYLGGDMVEGEYGNYPSQPYDIDSSVIEQAMRTCPDIFEGMIYYFLRYFDSIKVIGVPGNHGRGASRHQTRHNLTNWDRVCYLVLRDRILGSDVKAKEKCECGSKRMWKNCCGKEIRKRVTFDIAEEFWCLDRVWDWGNLIVHGDQIRGWAGIPYYGVCMPTTHEILTQDGWKQFDQLVMGELVLTFDHLTHENRWEPVEGVNVFDYDGDLLRIDRPGEHSVLFTPNHKWPVEDYAGRRTLIEAKDLNTGHWLPLHGYFCGEGETALSPRLAAILGWIVTDGHLRWKGNHCEAVVYQSADNYFEEVQELLANTGRINHHYGEEKTMMCVPCSREDVTEITKDFKQKSDLPAKVTRLSRSAAESKFDAMMKAEARKRNQEFRQNPGPVAEAFQILSVMLGKTAWSTSDKEGCLTMKPRIERRIRPSWGSGIQKEYYQGKVWCPTTKSGTWWVRHNGMVLPTGNSKKTHGWADAMPKDWDNLLFGHFHTYAAGTINYRRWFCNGTTESANSYALEELASAGPPSQRLLFMTQKHGIISDHQIFLEDDRAPIMQRKFKQAALEYGQANIQNMLDVLFTGDDPQQE